MSSHKKLLTSVHSAIDIDLDGQPKPSRNKRKRLSDPAMVRESKDSRRLEEFQARYQKRARRDNAEILQLPQPSKKRGRPSMSDIANRAQLATQLTQSDRGGRQRRGRNSISGHPEPYTRVSHDTPVEHILGKSQEVREEPEAQYQHLASVNRHVPRHVIDSKWEPLPTNAVDRIVQILSADERSVVMRLRDERKRTYASTAIQMVIQRLRSKIIRGLPFPSTMKAQREEDFDYERIFDVCKALNAQLQPLLASVVLLKDKIDDELALLELERTAMEELERNAKDDDRTKQNSKGVHAILQLNDKYASPESSGACLNLIDRKPKPNIVGDVHNDSNLDVITDELYSHLESIISNLKQVHDVRPSIDRNRSILRDVLVDHLDSDHFVHVLMG